MSWQTQYQQYDQYGQYDVLNEEIFAQSNTGSRSVFHMLLDRCTSLLQTSQHTHPTEYKDGAAILHQIEGFFNNQSSAVTESHGVTALKAVLPILEKLAESALLTKQIEISQSRCAKYSDELTTFRRESLDLKDGEEGTESEIANSAQAAQQKKWGISVPPSAVEKGLIVGITEVIVDKPQTEYEGQNSGHQFTTYRIVVRCGVPNSPANVQRFYRIRRRFNDLRALHAGLNDCAIKNKIKIPSLPPMNKGGSKTTKFIEERRKKMGDYLQAVSAIPVLVQTKEFQEFMLTNAEYRSVGEGID